MKRSTSISGLLLLCVPGVAMAHPGHGAASGLLQGLIHPLSGLDHLLAMVAVGFWAAQLGGRAVWRIPCAFVGVMLVGGALGVAGVGVPFVEQGIVASVFVLGLLVAGACQLPSRYSTAIVGCFALFHGVAHGAELPQTMGAVSYSIGFILSTAVLHIVGVGLGMMFEKIERPNVNRYVGSAIALGGVFLAFA